MPSTARTGEDYLMVIINVTMLSTLLVIHCLLQKTLINPLVCTDYSHDVPFRPSTI